MAEITVTFPGGKRVDAQVGNHHISTDQPRAAGGDDSAPAPFSLFLASIGTCAGIYVLGFCQARGIDTTGITLTQRSVVDRETGVLSAVEIDVRVPEGFPAQYREALVRVASKCAVKKAIAAQPEFRIAVTAPEHRGLSSAGPHDARPSH